MIILNKDELRDRVNACWIGKNIGGTLGGPFEREKHINTCTGFTTPAGEPLPNDDLDLQLIWLSAVRQLGPENVTATTLGEYWLEFITPFWEEYGISKANMRRGIMPPICGQYRNHMKHSNGAWIRTEVWATLYPGEVEKAVHYAYQDACVDHGCGEGTYSALFMAALQSAAFLVQDIRKLINIGLSKIPETCRIHKYVTKIVECYENGYTWLETRDLITNMSLEDEELGWFQAPANIGYAIIGLLYGESDFKKSLLIACNCGDDTDCSCATVGAVLGIVYGTKIIPDDWKSYIGDDIVTISINMAAGPKYDKLFPKTCTDLTNRIMELHPVTMRNSQILISDDQTSLEGFNVESLMGNEFAMRLLNLSDYYIPFSSILCEGMVELERVPEIQPNESIQISLSLKKHFSSQKVYRVRWLLPEGWKAEGAKTIYGLKYDEYEKVNYLIIAGESTYSENRIVLEISCDSHFDVVYVPVMLCS